MLMFKTVRKYSTNAIPRWFRAVDVPDTKPGIYGYKPNKKPVLFEAFSPKDSSRLESAFEKNQPSVIVENDGLSTVDMKKKLCHPTFWDGPAFAVRRNLWFELAGTKVIPLDPEMESKIEELFQTMRNKSIELQWPTKDGVTEVTGTFASSEKAELGEEPILVLTEKKSWISAFSKRNIYRGIPKTSSSTTKDVSSNNKGDNRSSADNSSTAKLETGNKVIPGIKMRSEYQKRDIKHLVFCVHGIGQLLSVKFEQINFIKDVDGLRQLIQTTYPKLEKKGTDLGPDSGIQVLPVMWRHKLKGEINGLKPAQLFGTTNLAADAVLDFVMYTEPSEREQIQKSAADEMNRMFRTFCELHPEFAENPKVSIIGHSLGSVIAHDLVNPEAAFVDLKFPITNLFTLGSPIGVLDLIRKIPTVSKGKAKAMYNIMRLADPVAARQEPLVTHKSLSVAPKPLPGGGTNLIQQVRELIGDFASQGEMLTSKTASMFQFITSKENEALTKKPSSQLDVSSVGELDLSELKQFNRHGRLDFSVQETMDLSLLLGLAGHLMYLDNPDVVRFILNELLELSDPKDTMNKN